MAFLKSFGRACFLFCLFITPSGTFVGDQKSHSLEPIERSWAPGKESCKPENTTKVGGVSHLPFPAMEAVSFHALWLEAIAILLEAIPIRKLLRKNRCRDAGHSWPQLGRQGEWPCRTGSDDLRDDEQSSDDSQSALPTCFTGLLSKAFEACNKRFGPRGVLNLDLLPFPTTFTIFGGVVPSMCVSSLASLWMCGAGCQLTSNPKLWHEPHPKRHFRRVSQLQAGSHQSEPEDRKTRGSQLR